MYNMLADGLLFIHSLFVFFVVGGMLLILIGGIVGWSWIRNWWFRLTHLVCILFVVAETWFGLSCPLTLWEMQARLESETEHYEGGFIQYWLSRLLFYEASEWVFVLVYSLFGLLAILVWILYPPYRR